MIFHRTRSSRRLCPRTARPPSGGPADFFRGHDAPKIRDGSAASNHQSGTAGRQGNGRTRRKQRDSRPPGGQLRGKPARSAQYARSWLRLAAHKVSHGRAEREKPAAMRIEPLSKTGRGPGVIWGVPPQKRGVPPQWSPIRSPI